MHTEDEGQHVATVLLVDDKPANLKLLFEALKGTGYRTLAALDGESAVRQAELARPDLILMDVMMPGIDGFEACQRLKAQAATRHIPVIFMTALTEISDKVTGFKAGGVDYLTKPLQHDEVLARIDVHLSRHRLWADVDTYGKILLDMGAAETLEEAWAALEGLPGTQHDIAGLAVWITSNDALLLRHASGFTKGYPSLWQQSQAHCGRVSLTDPLLGAAFLNKRQCAAATEAEWKPYPAWAKTAELRAHIVSPICCRDACFGVMAAFFRSPVTFAFEERKRWHQLLARSLGNAIFQARSIDSIRQLSAQLKQENDGLRHEVSASATAGGMIGDSIALRRVLDQVDLVAPTEAAVLILGESGTGKELLAQRLHERSRRKESPIIRVNCAAIPRELFESEFFGHVKGSFTGAIKDRAGRFELADGGTLFLDEVGEIPIELQGKLLRVLQEGTFERIGEEKTRKTDVRVVAATNRNLQQVVAAGHFRQDLFYRLSVFPLTLPPLRERREDIPLLVRHFASVSARKMGLSAPTITDGMLATLTSYDWPGNVRELQNEIERAMILSRGGALMLAPPVHATIEAEPGCDANERLIPEAEWEAMQRDNLLRALRQTAWRVDGPGGAAELLGLRPTTLRSRMKAMNIVRPV